MNTFLPARFCGREKVLRYHVRPLHWFCSPRWPSREKSSNVSVSLYVCGSETADHWASSKAGAMAFVLSALRNFQPGSKLSVRRSSAGDEIAKSMPNSNDVRRHRSGSRVEQLLLYGNIVNITN